MEDRVYKCALLEPYNPAFLSALRSLYVVHYHEDFHNNVKEHYLLVYTDLNIKKVAKNIFRLAQQNSTVLGKDYLEEVTEKVLGCLYEIQIGWKSDLSFLKKLLLHILNELEIQVKKKCALFKMFKECNIVTIYFHGIRCSKEHIVVVLYETIVEKEGMYRNLWFKVTNVTTHNTQPFEKIKIEN